MEKYLHNHYKDSQYLLNNSVSGYSEWFKIEDEDELLYAYDEIIKNPLKYLTIGDISLREKKQDKPSKESTKEIYSIYGVQ